MLVDDRADLCVRIGGIADAARVDPLKQPAAELLVDRILDIDPARGGALLPGRPERARIRRLHRPADVGVLGDDQRVVAAELELHALAEACGLLAHAVPDGNRAGEGDRAHARVGEQRLADLRSAADHDVEHALG